MRKAHLVILLMCVLTFITGCRFYYKLVEPTRSVEVEVEKEGVEDNSVKTENPSGLPQPALQD